MRFVRSTLSLLLAGTLAGCMTGGDDAGTNDSEHQLLRGQLPLQRYSAEVVGVRVVSNGQSVAAASTDAEGRFELKVPRGQDYHFEIVTKSGSHSVLTGPIDGPTPMSFDVCDPGEDYDLGEINPFDFEEIDGDEQPWTETEDDCEIPPWICEPGPNGELDESCFDEPLPCDLPEADPDFCFDEPLPCEDPAADPNFCFEEPPFCDDPDAPECEPWPEPPPCESDSPEECEPWIPEPCDDPNDADCEPWNPEPCDEGDPSCEPVPEPPVCEDPNDPDCEPWIPEPCLEDGSCDDGWSGECESAYDDPSCWPEPDICILSPEGGFEACDDETGAAPEFPFPDFGCDLFEPIEEEPALPEEPGDPNDEPDLPEPL